MRKMILRLITRLIRVPAASKSWSQYLKSASQAVKLAFLTTTPGHPQGGDGGDDGSGKGWGCKSRPPEGGETKLRNERWRHLQHQVRGWGGTLLSCYGEGNGNPLQYSCLGNPMDGRNGYSTKKEQLWGFPGGSAVKNLSGGRNYWSLSTLEPMLHNKRSHSNEKHLHCN